MIDTRKRCDYDFVEVMACPSGCINGGAQLRYKEAIFIFNNFYQTVYIIIQKDYLFPFRPEGEQTSKELISWLEAQYTNIETGLPEDNKQLKVAVH